MGYADYLERSGMSDQKLFILRALARSEEDPKRFLDRMEELRQIIREKENDRNCPFILSTIHASKGLEYDRVFLMDMADGLFPESVPASMLDASPKDKETFEEERRLFYVGVTRAKEELILFDTGKNRYF